MTDQRTWQEQIADLLVGKRLAITWPRAHGKRRALDEAKAMAEVVALHHTYTGDDAPSRGRYVPHVGLEDQEQP